MDRIKWSDAEFEIVLYYYLTDFDKYFKKNSEELIDLTNRINMYCGNNRTYDSIYLRLANYISVDESRSQIGMSGGDNMCSYYMQLYKDNPEKIRKKYPDFFKIGYYRDQPEEIYVKVADSKFEKDRIYNMDNQYNDSINSNYNSDEGKKISIVPTTGVYGTYKRTSYKPWFAIAEFIDNSTQSYFNHKDELKKEDGFRNLVIRIKYDLNEDILEIKDNAFGMNFEDFTRALVLDKPPKYRGGRNEFGMGLKTAACWFGNLWSVETTQLGLDRVYKAEMDIKRLEKEHNTEVDYVEDDINFESHYTIVTIKNLLQKPQSRTIGKIKDTLARMYRNDIKNGDIQIYWNDELLEYVQPKLLKDGNNEVKQEINFNVMDSDGKEYKVNGWVGILENGSYNNSGFVLMRRGRVIVGAVSNYSPSEIFGSSGGDYRKLYLTGEFYLDDFPVTQAKDGFEWDINGLEENFIEQIRIEGKDIIKAASNMQNVNKAKKIDEISTKKLNEIIDDVKQSFDFVESKEEVETIQSNAFESDNVVSPDQKIYEKNKEQIIKAIDTSKIMYSINKDNYKYNVYWNEDEAANWLGVKNHTDENGKLTHEVDIFINIRHKFFVPYSNDPEFLKLINKIAIAFVSAEKKAILSSTGDGSKISPESIRNHMNECLEYLSDKE